MDACVGISLQCGEVREEFENAQDLLSSMRQHPASLRTLHQIFGVLKTGMCNFTIFQNGLQPFSYYSSFFTCNKSGRGSETREWLVCLIFFFSLAKGTLQLYFLLLKRGTPWLNGKPEGSDSSDNGKIQIYGSGGGRKNGAEEPREEVTRTKIVECSNVFKTLTERSVER